MDKKMFLKLFVGIEIQTPSLSVTRKTPQKTKCDEGFCSNSEIRLNSPWLFNVVINNRNVVKIYTFIGGNQKPYHLNVSTSGAENSSFKICNTAYLLNEQSANLVHWFLDYRHMATFFCLNFSLLLIDKNVIEDFYIRKRSSNNILVFFWTCGTTGGFPRSIIRKICLMMTYSM